MKNIIQASKKDDKVAINLLLEALGDIASTLTGAHEIQTIKEELESFFLKKTRFYYKNIYLYKKDAKTIAAMCIYGGDKAKELDQIIIKHLQNKGININSLDTECFNDELYIDSISVDKDYRKQGIASTMFSFAKHLAKEQNYKKLSLVVDTDKHQVKKFYERLGFINDCNVTISNHTYHHMYKIV